MDKKEIILTITRDLLILALNGKHNVTLNLRGGDAAIDDLGDKFKKLSLKISEALDSIKD